MKNSLHIGVIVLVMSLFICVGSLGQSVRKGPYVIYGGDNTKMDVLWQDDLVSADTILWRNEANRILERMVVQEYGTDHQHRVVLTGLEPDTKYFYEVHSGINVFKGSFLTAPLQTSSSLSFFAYGDSRTQPENQDRIAGMINDCWMDQASSQTFVIHAGDLVTNGDDEFYWTNDLFNPEYDNLQHMLSNLPLMACRGNHEGSAVLFGKYFPYPFIEKYYYSIDYGPAHVAFVDIYEPFKAGTEQYDWLVNDLSRSDSPWKFVCFHEPAWSSGGGHANNLLTRDILEPLCETYHVAMIFAGHNHYYARAVVHTAEGDSVIHITTGGGGAPLHTPVQGMENVVIATRNFHFCKINIINDNLLHFEAISDSAKVIDQFIIDRKIAAIPDQDEKNLLAITPNPFITNALVEYTLNETAEVQILLCDLTGNVVKEIVPQTYQYPGNYKVKIDGAEFPPGVYVCKMKLMEQNGKTETFNRRIVIAR